MFDALGQEINPGVWIAYAKRSGSCCSEIDVYLVIATEPHFFCRRAVYTRATDSYSLTIARELHNPGNAVVINPPDPLKHLTAFGR